MKRIILIIFYFVICNNSFSQTWSTNFGDSLWIFWNGNYAQATVLKLLPVNNKLFISGGFNRIGSDTSFKITYWKNFHFNSMNSLNCWCQYKDLSFHNNKLYLAGDFQNLIGIDSLNYIATYDGTIWDFLTHQYVSEDVNTMSWKNDTLLIGGIFGGVNYIWTNRVALWDGNSYQPMDQGVGEPLDPSRIYCSAVYNNRFIIGGSFQSVAGQPHTAIAEWDGQHWKKMGLGLNGDIYSLYTDTVTNLLYAGGWILINGDTIPQTCFASWNGQIWHNLSDTIDGTVYSFINYRGKIFIGGGFTNIGHVPVKYLAKQNGTSWDSIANIDFVVQTMAVFNDELIIGGAFTKVNGVHAFGLARYYEPPDSACLYFAPTIYTDVDTFYLQNDTVSVAFYNNNSHANSWAWNFGDTGTDTVWCPAHVYNQPGTYIVNVNVTELWCNKSAQKTVVISDLLNSEPSIANSQQLIALKIFPNPASGSVTIEITGALSPLGVGGSDGKNNEPFDKLRVQQTNNELRITNPHGKTVKTIAIKENNSKTEINTKGWAKGTYLCSLLVGGKTVKVEKLVVE